MVYERIKEILADQLDAAADSMSMESDIAADLGADSLDVVELLMTIEDEFDGVDLFENVKFDYELYKSGIEYSLEDYELIKLKCEHYKQKKREINKKKFVEHEIEEESATDQIIKLNADLEESCFSICTNEQVLCEILLDICYRDNIDVNIVWNLCGDVIVNKLANKSKMYSYPEQDVNGEFCYGGFRFSMKNIIVGGESND